MPTTKTPRKGKAGSEGPNRPNFIIVASDGTLLLVSGSTGRFETLKPEVSKEVLPLLKQRQQLGRQLTELLKKRGFMLSDEDSIDIEIWP